jgi:hypothetical protein
MIICSQVHDLGANNLEPICPLKIKPNEKKYFIISTDTAIS